MTLSPNNILVFHHENGFAESDAHNSHPQSDNLTSDGGADSSEISLARLERVLHIDGERIYVINLSSAKNMPEARQAEAIQDGVAQQLISISDSEPFREHLQPRTWKKKHLARRDRDLDLIQPILDLHGGMYDPAARGPVIESIHKQHNVGKNRIYKLLRKWWRLGMVRNALLPFLYRKPYEERARPADHPAKKKGLWSALEKAQGKRLSPAVNDRIRKLFDLGIRRFLHKKGKRKCLGLAFTRTLSEYFNDGGEWDSKTGECRPKLLPKSLLPKFRTFQHYYYSRFELKKARLATMSERDYNQKFRPLEGNATLRSYGPGSCFEIDSTPLPVIIVEKRGDDKIILGKATLYLVVDVFSHLIVGFYIGLEEPSLLAAALAMLNTASDKVAYCKDFGIIISVTEWPACHIAEKIYADRAELKGLQAEAWVMNFSGWLENAPPYRPDLKPFVERLMQILDEVRLGEIPGVTHKMAKRGDSDPKEDACLTQYELTKIAIHQILKHNNDIIAKYPHDAYGIPDEYVTPSELYVAGLKDRCHLRTQTGNVLRANLLPVAEGKLDRGGVVFKNLRFLPRQELRRAWLTKTSKHGGEDVEISYFPKLVDFIYVRLANHEPEPFSLAPEHEKLRGKTYAEVAALHSSRNARRELLRRDTQERAAYHDRSIQEIVRNAKRESKCASTNGGHKADKPQIRKNRKAAATEERAKSPFAPEWPANRPPAARLPSSEDDYIGPYDPT